MNPFDWRGPEFLLFYLALAAAVLTWCWRLVRRDDGSIEMPRVGDLINDPYYIAFLRGGADETIRIAVFNLLDRGFLEFQRNKLQIKRADTALLRRPLDRALHAACAKPRTLLQLVRQAALRRACDDYAAELGRRRLLMDAAQRRIRAGARLAAIAVLLGVGVVKLVLAAHRGHSNVGFLMMLMIAAVLAVFAICGASQRTTLGTRALAQVRELTARLRGRAAELRPGGASADALLLAGVFGVAALPADAFAFVRQVYPRASDSGGSSCGSSSSCGGSSCGGSCGGGCGGCGGS